jgi:hypothetical protein
VHIAWLCEAAAAQARFKKLNPKIDNEGGNGRERTNDRPEI